MEADKLMQFKLIKPEELHSEWDFIKQGIDGILNKIHDRWLPEDIYWLIKQNSIWAYVVFDGDEKLGLVLLQPSAGWDGKELFLFGGFNIGTKDVIEFALPEILNVARHIGAKRIKFQSPRKGFEKYAANIGFEYSHSLYEREL
jgi:hypothetical protein